MLKLKANKAHSSLSHGLKKPKTAPNVESLSP